MAGLTTLSTVSARCAAPAIPSYVLAPTLTTPLYPVVAGQGYQDAIRTTDRDAIFAADYILYLTEGGCIELARVRAANSSGLTGPINATLYTHTPRSDVQGLWGTFDKTRNKYHNPSEKNQAKRGTV